MNYFETQYNGILVAEDLSVLVHGSPVVGPIVEISDTLRVGRHHLVLETFVPPPRNVFCYVGYRSHTPTHVDHLFWYVKTADLVAAAANYTDDELMEAVPTLLQLSGYVLDWIGSDRRRMKH